ncbi:hypothetical protein DFH08DRAFT_252120 [Mycena albidolilacea]|uniref:Uncharacterized protein n=1 Tax=Mycena albidolilacea TaxID=1033008 RepID=A0AAD6ZTY0_9AGAR|nr:hypothetical protein DFH08DRAFT_252120 [Mycena albidolilacea]
MWEPLHLKQPLRHFSQQFKPNSSPSQIRTTRRVSKSRPTRSDFAGLLLGVISACLALSASNILQRHIAIVDKQLTAIETTTAEQLDDLTLALTSGGLLPAPDMFTIQRRTTEKMVARFTELQRTLPNAARARATMRNSTLRQRLRYQDFRDRIFVQWRNL